MIKEKELSEVRPQIRIKDGAAIDLQQVQEAIQKNADKNGVPIAFRNDQVKFGGLIGGAVLDCLAVHHPEHEKDYSKLAIIVKHQGNYAFVSTFGFGESRLMGNQASHDYMVSAVKKGWKSNDDMDFAKAAGAVLGAGVRRVIKGGRDNQKLEEEQNWYAMVSDILDEIFS